jgi:hypothetical protein
MPLSLVACTVAMPLCVSLVVAFAQLETRRHVELLTSLTACSGPHSVSRTTIARSTTGCWNRVHLCTSLRPNRPRHLLRSLHTLLFVIPSVLNTFFRLFFGKKEKRKSIILEGNEKSLSRKATARKTRFIQPDTRH